MPVFKYKAISVAGENITGTYNAKVKEEVLGMLRDNRYYPVEVNEVIEGTKIEFNILKKVSIKDLAIFCRQFYAMLNAGVTIIACLNILSMQTENKVLRVAIGQVYEEVQKGLNFSEALRNHRDIFPELFINMVEAGEVSGQLDVIMGRMATHFEKENKINSKMKGAMIYPSVIGIVALIAVSFLLIVVLPKFMEMFTSSGTALPGPTQLLLNISGFIRKYWYIVILGLGGGIYGSIMYTKSDNGRLVVDRLKFKIPIVKGSMQKIATSRFTRTLSTLLSSGIPLLQAMDIVAKVVGNKLVADGILNVKEEVKKGSDLAEPLKNLHLFPPMLDNMIRIGEEAGSLEEILEKTANIYDEELEAALDKLVTLIEPVMIVVMASVVGFIVVAMVMPMFDMVNTVKMN